MAHDHEMSAPPSPPPAPPAESTGRYAALPSHAGIEDSGARALRIALATRKQFGEPPNPVTGQRAEEGTLWHVVAGMQGQLSRLEDTTAKILARLDTEDTTSGKRRGWFAARGERLIDLLLSLAVAALLVYLGGFHR